MEREERGRDRKRARGRERDSERERKEMKRYSTDDAPTPKKACTLPEIFTSTHNKLKSKLDFRWKLPKILTKTLNNHYSHYSFVEGQGKLACRAHPNCPKSTLGPQVGVVRIR